MYGFECVKAWILAESMASVITHVVGDLQEKKWHQRLEGTYHQSPDELVTHGKRGKRCVMDAYFLSELPTQFTLSLFFNVFEIATSQTAAWYHELFEIMGR